jgi:hypothetical protein
MDWESGWDVESLLEGLETEIDDRVGMGSDIGHLGDDRVKGIYDDEGSGQESRRVASCLHKEIEGGIDTSLV